MRPAHLLLPLLVLAPAPAAADASCWSLLPGLTRAVPLEETASRDAPVFEWAYGPRAQLSLGHTIGLATRGGGLGLHLTTSALAALEDATGGGVFPDQLARFVATLGLGVSFDRAVGDALGRGGAVELGLELGAERARELVAAESERVSLPPEPGEIPFGAGGLWAGLDVALRARVGQGTLTARVADRMYTNAFPLLFGLRAESGQVASFLDEGLTHAPSLALGLRWHLAPRIEPVARVFVEGLLPHDDSADASVFARAVVGLAILGDHGGLEPFVSADAGSGKGLLVNRHELRLSVGARHVFR